MNRGKWYSKKDVMKDLVRATGIRHFDENTFVVGERPPPSRRDSENDLLEMEYRYGGALPDNIPNEFEKPDLEGITEMLRLVDTYNETLEESKKTRIENKTNEENSGDNILTISKLNPDVQEFLPGLKNDATCVRASTSQATSSNDEKNGLVNHSKHLKDDLQKYKSNENVASSHNNDKPNSAVQVNKNSTNEPNVHEMREKLKTKISNTSNASCPKVKRERNLAIATLLKLHSQAPAPKTNNVDSNTLLKLDSQEQNSVMSTNDTSLKLMPPNYFQISSNTQKDKVDNEDEINVIPIDNINKNIAEKLQKDTNNRLNGHNVNEKITETTTNTEKNIPSVDNVNTNSTSHENVDHVDKVTKWLESNNNVETEPNASSDHIKENVSDQPVVSRTRSSRNNLKGTPKRIPKTSSDGPSIYLGQVTFKRKEVPVSNSPSLCSSDAQTTRKTPSSIYYVPTAYAIQLSKTYTERANAKKELEQNIWTKLESELKAIDEKKMKEMEEDKNNQPGTSTD